MGERMQSNLIEKTEQNKLFVWRVFPFVFCYTLALNYFLRRDIVGATLGYGNWLFLFWVMLFIYCYAKELNLRLLWLIPFPFLLWQSEHDLLKVLMETATMIVPLTLGCINLEMSKEDAIVIVKRFLKIFNVLVYFVFFLMMIDLVSHNSILTILGNISDDYLEFALKAEEEVLRQSSLFGHQLGTKTIFLVFFSLNELFEKIEQRNKWSRWINLIIALVAIVLTGSKSGFVIFAVLLIYFYLDLKKPISIIGVSLIVVAAYFGGMMDALLERFQTTDLTTGRVTGWNNIQDSLQKPQLFFGEGQGLFTRLELTNKEQEVQAAFELPVLGYLYQFGFLFTFLLLFILFGRLLILFLGKNGRVFFIPYLMMILDMNGYNQLLFNPDFVGVVMMINLVYVLLLLINKSKVTEKNRDV